MTDQDKMMAAESGKPMVAVRVKCLQEGVNKMLDSLHLDAASCVGPCMTFGMGTGKLAFASVVAILPAI